MVTKCTVHRNHLFEMTSISMGSEDSILLLQVAMMSSKRCEHSQHTGNFSLLAENQEVALMTDEW